VGVVEIILFRLIRRKISEVVRGTVFKLEILGHRLQGLGDVLRGGLNVALSPD
jgi:hypothetical protein